METNMSYDQARFDWASSDVYVFMHVEGWLECSMCALGHGQESESYRAGNTKTMMNHLNKHELSGHHVPTQVYELLLKDDSYNFNSKTK